MLLSSVFRLLLIMVKAVDLTSFASRVVMFLVATSDCKSEREAGPIFALEVGAYRAATLNDLSRAAEGA